MHCVWHRFPSSTYNKVIVLTAGAVIRYHLRCVLDHHKRMKGGAQVVLVLNSDGKFHSNAQERGKHYCWCADPK